MGTIRICLIIISNTFCHYNFTIFFFRGRIGTYNHTDERNNVNHDDATMASAANHNGMTAPTLALLQIVLFVAAFTSSSEAASTGLAKSQSPAILRPTVMHPAFESAGKTAGLKIWRIEVNENIEKLKKN